MSRLSQQQRRFADMILEGKSQTQAYKDAGYKCANDNVAAVSASELVRNPKVVAYIEDHRKEAARALQIDLQWLIAKGVAILEAAENEKAYGPAVSALKELGILTGERVEKSDRTNRNIDDTSELTRDELYRIARGSSEGAIAAGFGAGKPH